MFNVKKRFWAIIDYVKTNPPSRTCLSLHGTMKEAEERFQTLYEEKLKHHKAKRIRGRLNRHYFSIGFSYGDHGEHKIVVVEFKARSGGTSTHAPSKGPMSAKRKREGDAESNENHAHAVQAPPLELDPDDESEDQGKPGELDESINPQLDEKDDKGEVSRYSAHFCQVLGSSLWSLEIAITTRRKK